MMHVDVTEGSQNPLDQPMATMPLVENQAPVVDDAGLKQVKTKIDAKDNKDATRYTVDDAKDFLEKDKKIFDDHTRSN